MAGGAEARRRKRIQHMFDVRLAALEGAVKELQSGQVHGTRLTSSLGPCPSSLGTWGLSREERASLGEEAAEPVAEQEATEPVAEQEATEPVAEQQSHTIGKSQRTGTDSGGPPVASKDLEGQQPLAVVEQPAHSDTCNVHTWAITVATSRKHSRHTGWAALSGSFVFALLETILLAGTMLESSFRRCGEHKDCHEGEWCSPALFPPFTTSPGVCFDCWSALHLHDARFGNATYETSPDPYERMAEAAGDTWLQEGYQYCRAKDKEPRTCDFLHSYRSRMSEFNLWVLFAVTVFIMAPVSEDLDEISVHEGFAFIRLEGLPNKIQRQCTRLALWCLFRVRCFVLPLFIISASLGLMLTLELTSYNLLLNGFAITFMTTLDDMLESLFIHPSAQREGIAAVCPVDRWLFNRFYSLFLGGSLVVTVLKAAWLMPFFGNEAKWGSPCSDIREVTTALPGFVTYGAAIIRPFFLHVSAHRRTWWRDPWGLMIAIADAAITPVFVWNFVGLATGEYFLLQMQAGNWV